MKMTRKKRRQLGFTLMEVLIASSVMMVVIGGSMSLQSRVFTQTTRNNDRAFASEKATQMFEELRSYVQSNRETDIAKLQNFSDGSDYSHVLTTEKKIVTISTGEEAQNLANPADPISGNKLQSGKWRFLRQVQINPIQNDPNARHVVVKIWYASNTDNTQPSGQPLASISGILKTNITEDAPTQVYDLYLIAMENAPSWWVDIANLRPAFERTLLDLEQRNPGLTFRRHFIDKFGFGRDPYYMPYINNDPNNTANTQALPWSFLYPGRVQNASISENYVLQNINGRMRTDTENRFYPLNKSHANYALGDYREYALADQFNHVMRFPEQIAMERRLVDQDPETYRENSSLITFLHRLNEGALDNAIIVNLHGELLPVPAIRNYSDPAKAPNQFARRLDAPNRDADPTSVSYPANIDVRGNADYVSLAYKRIVTHPERLRYDNDSSVAWRVYAYEEVRPGRSDLGTTANPVEDTAPDKDFANVPITSLFLPTIDRGPRFSGADNNGYLAYPDLALADTQLIRDQVRSALTLQKIVGDDTKPYERWNSTDTGLRKITYTHHNQQADAVFLRDDRVSGVLRNRQSTSRAIGSRSNGNIASVSQDISAGANELIFGESFDPSERERLVNSLIVLDSGTSNEEVVRVEGFSTQTNVPGSLSPVTGGNNVIVLNRPLERGHTTTDFSGYSSPPMPALVNTLTGGLLTYEARSNAITRHKDFDIEIVNEDMFQHSHRGIRVLLYDTPTRQPRNASNNNRGLNETRRLDALEYIPGPLTNTSGVPTFEQDLTNNQVNAHKNTARWRIELDTSAAVFNGEFNFTGSISDPDIVPVFPIETRFGTSDYYYGTPQQVSGNVSYRAANSVDNCSTNLAELCDGIWGDGDAYIPDATSATTENDTVMRPHLYNVSRSYIYMNREFTDKNGNDFPSLRIPKAEQAQFLGDPMLSPYIDVKELHRYNRHYRDYDGNPNNINGYNRANGRDWDRTNVDMNWYFNLYSNGIMRSNAIYNSISGFSNYYYSLGGELGTDGTNAVFPINRQPWTETNNSSSLNNNNNAINEITVTSRVISSTASSTSGGIRWRARTDMGEMFPDDEFEFWLANGNLPSNDYNNATHHGGLLQQTGGTATPVNQHYYFRQTADSSGDSFGGIQAHRRMQTRGAPSFMNGSSDPIGSINAGLQHISNNGTADLTSGAGQFVVNSFNLNLNESMGANRPYILNGNSGDGGYTTSEFQTIRNRLNFVNNTDGSLSGSRDANNTYYDHSSNSARTSSAMVRMSRPNPSSPSTDVPGLVGYVLINGLQQAGTTGIQEMARFTQAGSLQTYMDAGDRNIPGVNPGRTVQLPRVQITSPKASQVQIDPTTINVNYQVDWLRWDGKPYSPAYPANWYDSVPIMFNVKYSSDNKRTWKYANGGNTVTPEFEKRYNSLFTLGAPASTNAPLITGSYPWNTAGFPSGNYVFRLEVYREGYTEVGYSYHNVFVTIER